MRDGKRPMQTAFYLRDTLVEPRGQEIIVDGTRIRVRRKLMEAITYLAQRNGEVVTRGELLEHLWPKRVASDESLTQLVSELRRVLGSEGEMLQTVPGTGYRLMSHIRTPAPARQGGDEAALAASDRRWGFALLLGVLVTAQVLSMLLGAGHHP